MDEVKAGRTAQRILNDDVFQRAVQQADDRFVSEWRDAETMEERERAHAKQAALTHVVQELQAIMGSGQIAKARSEE